MNFHDYFIYDKDNGGLIWKERPISMFVKEIEGIGTAVDATQFKVWNKKNAGNHAGHIENNGYVRIKLFEKKLSEHRIVWTMLKGEIPRGYEIDHVNRDRNDNRIENLRCVKRNQNQKNIGAQKNNQSGVKGVFWCNSRNKWVATSQCKDAKFQRTFNTLDEAIEAITKFRDLHGIPNE